MGVNKKIGVLLLLVLFFTNMAYGQGTITPTWEKTIPEYVWRVGAAPNYFVVATQQNTVYAFSYSGNILWKNESIDGVPYYIVTSPTGNLIAVGAIKFYNSDWSKSDEDHAKLCLLNKNGDILWSLEPETDTQRIMGNVIISSDSRYILFGIWNEIPGDFDNHRVYLVDTLGNIIWYNNIGDDINDIQATSDFSYILVGAKNGAHLLDKSEKDIWDTTSSSSINIYPVYKVGINEVYNMAVLGTGSHVYFLNLNDGKVLKKYSVDARVTDIEVSPNGNYIVVGLYNGEILTFNRFGELLWEYSSSGKAENIVISPDNSQVYFYSNDGTIYAFDIKTGELRWSYYSGEAGHGIAINSDGSYLVAGGESTIYAFRPNVGYLTVYSTPSGADVYVDNQYIGQTPIENYELPRGEHSLTIQMEGYQEYYTTVFIMPGETSIINANLGLETGILSVTSAPTGALVYINGEYKGKTPLNLELPPRTYTVKIAKQNYIDYTTTMTLQAGETREISVSLIPAGYLTVYSTPSSAEVYVNEEYIGTTPITNYKMPTGTYTILVKKAGYNDYTSAITIEAGKTEVVNAELVLKTASLSVYSTPSGASVYIGGDYKGQTPLTLEVPPGTYTIEIRKTDYKSHTETITIQAGEKRQINVQLEALFGFLNVYSNVQGASVYIDGSYVGKTPLKEYKISTGSHRIEVRPDNQDYNPYSETVVIEPTKTHTINARLTLKEVTLSVGSTPTGADVYVNNQYSGTTPLTLKLTPGTYSVKITKDDYEPYVETVTLNPGESKSINIQLKALFGFLNIYSNVQGADVYIDGVKVGITPLKAYKLSVGDHKIEIRKEGYETFSQSLVIEPTKTHTINTRLTKAGIWGIFEKLPTNNPIALYTGGGLLLVLLLALVVGVKKRRGAKVKVDEKVLQVFPSELLKKYQPLEFLGEGGFAKVFKVKRKSDGKIIALKLSNLDEKAKKFLMKEMKAWKLLNHPNIVKLYNAYTDPIPHLEIEYVEGVKIGDKVVRDLGSYPKPVGEEQAIKFVKDIAKGLKHAHSKNVFHRDLKPQNILLKSDLTPKITDWGLAKVGAVSTTATTTKGLTLLYAAPEQVDEETYGHTDHRTDIYQLGMIFYELLTGKLPYDGSTPSAIMAKLTNPNVKPKLPSQVSESLAKYDNIFKKLLAKRKEDRYQSIDEFLNDIELLEKLEKEKKALKEEIQKTKTRITLSKDREELRRLKEIAVEQLTKLALLHARHNEKAELIKVLQDLKDFTKDYKKELENAIKQFEMMIRDNVQITQSTIEELDVLLHKIRREVEK
ncbi:MAG: PEGA domain-containing protein [Archaeoglobus sp.]|nr:PEGA domain-containing protein [Archaeoglobus sp.]